MWTPKGGKHIIGEQKMQNNLCAINISAFSKGQKSSSKFLKAPETKKMSNKTFKCSKLLLSFFKKSG